MTNYQLDKMLSNIVIIIDNQEKQIQHITDHFKSKGIEYIYRHLSFGDYSVMLGDEDYSDRVSIERKFGLNEITTNITKWRERFENELERGKNAKFALMIEEAQGFEKIVWHKYRSDTEPKAFIATLNTYTHRYGLDVNYIEKPYAGPFIYYYLYYFVRERLKEMVA